MIGRLTGVLQEKYPPHLLLEVHGVGYELEASMTTFSRLPAVGQELTLFTHQVVREDAHSLYAFSNKQERDVFRQLLRINGVGAKLALSILSGMEVAELSRCVYERDATKLAKLPGVGKKTAERLLVELRDRIDASRLYDTPMHPTRESAVDRAPDPYDEAIRALVTLGFKFPEATRRVRAVGGQGLACEEIVRRALQSVAK